MLYKFENLAILLTQLGFPDVNQRGIQIIKRDLTQEEQAGNLDFRNDGIYLNLNGQEYKGYMYLKFADVARFGFPKFHITNCKTILEQRETGRFNDRYFWHNSRTVTIEDRANGHLYESVNLTLCGNCARQSSIDQYSNTEGFYSLLDQQEVNDVPMEIQLDMFGRPLNWDEISKEYKREKNYTCEKCGFGGDMLETILDREFIHTDHIIAWELTNMKRNNLQCLCILCHSQKDDLHQLNFAKIGMKKRLFRFIERYKLKLRQIDNPYIENF